MELALKLNKTDDSFIAAAIRQEEWAQKKIYEDHYPTMFPVCCRYANNDHDALDIMHDGFVKVYRHLAKYQVGTSLTAWIKRIMINTAIDYYRKEKRRQTSDLDTVYDVSSPDHDVVSVMSADEIIECLNDLTPAYRTVFNLYVVEGFSHKEIADQLNITESTSRSNLVKARNNLKLLLQEKGIVHV